MEMLDDLDCLNRRQEPSNLSKSSFNDSEAQLNDDLPLLQPIWMLFLMYSDYVKSPLFPIVVGVGSYFLCLVPYTFLDYFGRDWNWVRRSKNQPGATVSWSMTRHAIVFTMWTHVLYVLPVSIAQSVWTPPTYLPCRAPSLWQFVWHQYIALVIFDSQYYLWHVLHHYNRFLYRHVHSIHHRYATLICWSSQYLHPWELLSVGVFGTTAPWVLGLHPLTTWSFMFFLNFVSIDIHSGYYLPFAPQNWIPFYGSSAKHDMHHLKPMSNFQPYFIWFDYLTGNHCPVQRKTKTN